MKRFLLIIIFLIISIFIYEEFNTPTNPVKTEYKKAARDVSVIIEEQIIRMYTDSGDTFVWDENRDYNRIIFHNRTPEHIRKKIRAKNFARRREQFLRDCGISDCSQYYP